MARSRLERCAFFSPSSRQASTTLAARRRHKRRLDATLSLTSLQAASLEVQAHSNQVELPANHFARSASNHSQKPTVAIQKSERGNGEAVKQKPSRQSEARA